MNPYALIQFYSGPDLSALKGVLKSMLPVPSFRSSEGGGKSPASPLDAESLPRGICAVTADRPIIRRT